MRLRSRWKNLRQFKQIIHENVAIIMLDNMSVSDIKKAVALKKQLYSKKGPLLEVSGGVNLSSIKKIAQTGVDRISIGALTHSARTIDFSLEIE